MTNCSGRFAQAWQHASFWCIEQLLTGTHEGAGPADAALVDSQRSFLTMGARPMQGYVLYNLTKDTSGPVTAVTETTLTATGVTWAASDSYRITLINGVEIATIEHWLDVAASDIHMALLSANACDCTLATGALGYLEKLNIIDAASYYNCKCGNTHLSDDMKRNYLTWMGTQLQMIATGATELCHGETGSNFPAMGSAQQAVTDFNAALIIVNDLMRNSDV